MQSTQFSLRWARSFAFVLISALASLPLVQTAAQAPKKPTPPKIDKQILIFPESVVLEQWAHTLKLVNAPQHLMLLNPGQCIRVGIIATGDGRDSLLEKTQLSFRVEFAGHTDSFPLAPLAGVKQVKPEGGDFVTAALASANIQNPIPTMASLGASADHWCVPDDAQDSIATIEAEIETPSDNEKLARAKIQIESFEAGSKRTFKDAEEVSQFLMSYHWQPNPARLYPALQIFAADTKWRTQTGAIENNAASFGAALKANPVAAKDFMTRVATQNELTRTIGLLVLFEAGYDINPLLKTMSEKHQQMFAQGSGLPDPYDFTHVEDIGTRLDMLWGKFMMTGDFVPMQQITAALKWHSDWDAFEKMIKTPNHSTVWTPSIGRAVGYGAAGWSLSSFQRNDPLATDYIEYMISSPDTPPEIKAELKGLSSNPAFKESSQK